MKSNTKPNKQRQLEAVIHVDYWVIVERAELILQVLLGR